MYSITSCTGADVLPRTLIQSSVRFHRVVSAFQFSPALKQAVELQLHRLKPG